MEPFTTLKGIAVPMPASNINTDIIYPHKFLRTVKRTGLGQYLFHYQRFDENGNENPDFILNKPPYNNAKILIAGENFAIGSSREHAAWALLDFGIRCVIAPSFGDIFYNNSYKNGLLTIRLPKEQVNSLLKEAEESPENEIEIDLKKQEVKRGDKLSFSFEIDPFRKNCLLQGLDEIGLTLQHQDLIKGYEETREKEKPWL